MPEHCPRILIVDDDPPSVQTLAQRLLHDGYQPLVACCAEGCLDLARSFRPDLVLLDLALDELAVCRELRLWSDVPIVVVTARDSEEDHVAALKAGVDGYVIEPCGTDEVMARIGAILRRAEPQSDTGIVRHPQHGFVINRQRHELFVRGVPTHLPPKEFDVLYLLAAHPDRVFTRETLLREVWGLDADHDNNTVEVHIHRIRDKIESDPSHPRHVLTIRGRGYRFG